MKKRIGLILLCLILFCAAGLAESDYLGSMQVFNCEEWVSLRSKPDTGSERLAKVPLDAIVENCYTTGDKFIYAEYEGLCGFILSEYLTDTFSEPEQVQGNDVYLGSMRVVNCEEWVSLRAKPDAKSDRLVKVPLGSIAENCYAHDGEFIYAEYDGRCGFIKAEYLEPVGDAYAQRFGSMQVINCPDWVPMYVNPGFESPVLQKIPLNSIVDDCVEAANGYIRCSYKGLSGYVDGFYLSVIEGPYADSDDWLMLRRIELNRMGAGLGVYLISDSMGGEWSILKERRHLDAVLNGTPEAWWPLLGAIGDECIVDIIGGQALYLIIPADEDASVTVDKLLLGLDGYTGFVDDVLYRSYTGEPILVRCNAYQGVLDCLITIEDSSGNTTSWYPDWDTSTGFVRTGAEVGTCVDFTEYAYG